MFELPMLMFRMTGIDSLIELTMDEVWGFPDSTSYGGGYAAKGIISIKSCNYSAKDTHYFTTGELYCFAQELNKCYTSLNGVAVLHNIERELELECAFNKFGHVIIIGRFQAAPDAKNILQFEDNERNIYRMKPNGSDLKLLLNVKNLSNTLIDQDYIRYSCAEIVGDWLYFSAEAWGQREGQGYRDRFLNSTFNRIKLDGTGLQIINSIKFSD